MNQTTTPATPPLSGALFIYGPQGCGKTRHAAALAKHFGKSRIVDSFEDRVDVLVLTECDLVLTNEPHPAVNCISFDDAMSQAGITLTQLSTSQEQPVSESSHSYFLLSQSGYSHPHINESTQDQASLDAISMKPS